MSIAGYLLCSTGVRYRTEGSRSTDIKWLEKKPSAGGRFTPENMKHRVGLVMELIPPRIKNLVIVNGTISDAELVQAAAEAGEKHADNLEVITAIMARVSFALYEMAMKPRSVRDRVESVILIVTITEPFSEYIILRRDENIDLFIAECFERRREEVREIFPQIYDDLLPDATIMAVDEAFVDLARELEDQIRPTNFLMKIFKRWDYMLMYGGLYRAMDETHGFDKRFRLRNFTYGIEARIRTRHSYVDQVILPDRTEVPCKIYGIPCEPQILRLEYPENYYQYYNELKIRKWHATTKNIQATGSPSQILGYVNAKGVPLYFMTHEEAIKYLENLNLVDEKTNEASYGESDLQVIMVFTNDSCCVKVKKDGKSMRIKNDLGNEWTPLFLSMAESYVEIGEKARNHQEDFPQSVVHDFLQIIGRQLDEVQIKPEWGFKLIKYEDTFFFGIQTPTELRHVQQYLVISAFLKVLKTRAELNLEIPVIQIALQTCFQLNESQKSLFVTAASKIGLEIVSFIVNNNEV